MSKGILQNIFWWTGPTWRATHSVWDSGVKFHQSHLSGFAHFWQMKLRLRRSPAPHQNVDTDTNHPRDRDIQRNSKQWELSAEGTAVVAQTALTGQLPRLHSFKRSVWSVTPCSWKVVIHDRASCVCRFDTDYAYWNGHISPPTRLKGIYFLNLETHSKSKGSPSKHNQLLATVFACFYVTPLSQYFIYIQTITAFAFRFSQQNCRGMRSAKNTSDGSHVRDMLHTVQLWSFIFPCCLRVGLRLVSHNRENIDGKQAKSGMNKVNKKLLSKHVQLCSAVEI